MTAITDRLKAARKKSGLTQAELASKCGVSTAAVGQWETGSSKSPTPENAFLVADVTGVSARWLVTGKGLMLKTGAERPLVSRVIDSMSGMSDSQQQLLADMADQLSQNSDK